MFIIMYNNNNKIFLYPRVGTVFFFAAESEPFRVGTSYIRDPLQFSRNI